LTLVVGATEADGIGVTRGEDDDVASVPDAEVLGGVDAGAATPSTAPRPRSNQLAVAALAIAAPNTTANTTRARRGGTTAGT
jgi:hypothetical protein